MTPSTANPSSGVSRRALQFAGVVTAMAIAIGCNDIFDIRRGTPRPADITGCANPAMIDDLEDGDGNICSSAASAGRQGSWYTVGDDTGTMLEPAPGQPFIPDMIPGGRRTSSHAAHMTGSGFTERGAAMGFHLNVPNMVNQTYDVGTAGGIKFWMKSNEPISVGFLTPSTIPMSQSGGTCSDGTNEFNCDNPLEFFISAPSSTDWVEYDVPFTALGQPSKNNAEGNVLFGSAKWNPASLIGVEFRVPFLGTSRTLSFDVWVDDVQFYDCTSNACVPTCTDPVSPVACPATGGIPAFCSPSGTVCSTASVLGKVLIGVWGSGPGDVWAVGGSAVTGAGTILRWNGASWSTSTSIDRTAVLRAVWGSAPADVWAVGDFGTILHWNGTSWTVVPSGTTESLNRVWGSGPSDVWTVGFGGTILHWDGSTWSPASSGTTLSLRGVWGSGPSDIWAVGFSETTFEDVIVHWDGSVWAAAPSGSSLPLFGVWGSGPGDVWAVGVGAVNIHWDGSTWSEVPNGATQALINVWGSGPGDVWAVGYGGTTLHWDGASWSPALSGTTQPLGGVWGSGPNNVWAVGQMGTILHWTGTSWSAVPKTTIH